jgi:hypothetical protein
MLTELNAYRQTILDLYLRLPDTPRRLSRYDLRLVRQLWEREVPLRIVEAAFLLASARRAARRPEAMPLGPIRSLHYFLPLIEELLAQPVPESYVAYLRSKVEMRPAPHAQPLAETYAPPAALFKFLRFYMRADNGCGVATFRQHPPKRSEAWSW